MPRPWFRIHTRAVDDPKLQKLSSALFKIWFNLCCIASEKDGILPSVETLSWRLHSTPVKIQQSIAELMASRLIDEDGGIYRMHDWDSWQYRDFSTERVNRFRKRQRNATETDDTVSCNDVETELKRQSPRGGRGGSVSVSASVRTKTERLSWFEEEFWPIVWAKIAVGAARKAWLSKVLDETTRDLAILAAKRQGPGILERGRRAGATTLHPSTWLNQERWKDEELLPPEEPESGDPPPWRLMQ